ncbi:MAG: TMEM43 family protein [bacterium]
MADDSYTEVTSESWFGRIGGAIKGVLFGLLLFIVAFPVLFWNEGRSVKTYKTLKEGGGAVVTVASESVDPANAGKLIHVTGKADMNATLTDPVFGVSAKALKLDRIVEMYQWEEKTEKKTKDKLGGGTETVTTYNYSKGWSGRLINSSSFKKSTEHQNPGAMPYESAQQIAPEVILGAFVLTPSLVGKINNYEPFPVGGNTSIPEALKEKVKLSGSGFYMGNDPAVPQIGDTRITFKVANPTEVSVIAKQNGKTFAPYATKAGGTIELLQTGVHTAAEMIQKAQSENTMLTWILRLVGFVVMMAGLSMILKPLSVIADVVPILGSIVGAGIGFIAFLISAVLSLTTIAIAWIIYRPLLAGLLIVVAVALVVVIKGKLSTAQTSS